MIGRLTPRISIEGSKLYRSRNYTKALYHFNRSLYQDSYYLDAWIHKGNLLLTLKKYNASIDSFTKALELNNSTIAAWVEFADVYTALGNYSVATEAMAKANELDPHEEGQLLQLQESLRMPRPSSIEH